MSSRYVHVSRSFLDGFKKAYSVDSLSPFILTPPLEYQGKLLLARTIEDAEQMVKEQHPQGRLPYWRELLASQEHDPVLPEWEITGTKGTRIPHNHDTDYLEIVEGERHSIVHVPREGGYVTRFGELGFGEETIQQLLQHDDLPLRRVYQRAAAPEFVVARRVLRDRRGFDVYLDLDRTTLRQGAVVRAVVPATE